MCLDKKELVDRIVKIAKVEFGSQKEMAKALGISSSIVSDWTSGRSGPTLKILTRLSEITNRSLDWYVFGKEDVNINQYVNIAKISTLWLIKNNIEPNSDLINLIYCSYVGKKEKYPSQTLEDFLEEYLNVVKNIKYYR